MPRLVGEHYPCGRLCMNAELRGHIEKDSWSSAILRKIRGLRSSVNFHEHANSLKWTEVRGGTL